MQMLYFAFGMNLHPRFMPGAVKVGPGRLYGWKLRFSIYADVVETGNPEDFVEGGVWKIDEIMLRSLDGREGYRGPGELNHYDRREVPVQLPWDEVQAIVYYMPPEAIRPLHPPDPGYLKIIEEGYEFFDLPEEALMQLHVARDEAATEHALHVHGTLGTYKEEDEDV